jgi:hypothetical protein
LVAPPVEFVTPDEPSCNGNAAIGCGTFAAGFRFGIIGRGANARYFAHGTAGLDVNRTLRIATVDIGAKLPLGTADSLANDRPALIFRRLGWFRWVDGGF